jgi:PAS domain S-box-containing protein
MKTFRQMEQPEILKIIDTSFRVLADISPAGIYTTDASGKCLYVNPAWCRMSGLSCEEAKGDGWIKAIHPDDLDRILSEWSKFIKGEIPWQNEYRFKYMDGGVKWIHGVAELVKDTAGNVQGIIGTNLDISDRKKSDEKLKASEAEFRSLFENSLMAISQAQPGGGIIRINKAYAEMYGYPDTTTMLDEVSKDTKSLFANPDDRKKVLEILERDGYMGPAEFELKRRNGEKFWALVSAKKVLDNAGKLLYLQAEHIDITSQKKLEKERYLASLYSRNLIEASLDPLVTINSDGSISDVNLATEEVTGVNRENLIGSDFADYFTDREKARTGYKNVFSKGMVKGYPLTIRHKSGKTTDVLYNATLFRNEAGEVQGIFAAARDITDLKKTERRVKEYQRQLQKLTDYLQDIREDERSKIALNLHDDFGQRLTALNLDIAWLKSRMGVQSLGVRKKLDEMSLMIHESIESIREVSSLLRPAILYDLGLVEAFEWQLKETEKQSGIRCYFSYDHNDYKLDDNISLILYRILQEALTNIIRHSEATSAEVSLCLVRKKIEMTITDNGKGIDESEINSLNSMGLAGLKERVRSVSGQAFISGQEGEGTTIKITVPLKQIKKL